MAVRVFRIHIRPDGGNNNPAFSFQYCLSNNVLGVGWGIEASENEIIDWPTYESRAIERHGKINVAKYLHREISVGGLIWTRGPDGTYYIAKVIAPWHYIDSTEARKADILNVIDVELVQIPQHDDVPGAVIASFRARKTLQAMNNPFVITYSQMIWNDLSRRKEYEPTVSGSVWSMLSDEQTEDLVFIYLQTKGWIVIPNSRKKDTMSYEFLLMHRDNGDRATVQVRTGDAVIDLSFYRDSKDKVFLFQPNECFRGKFSERLCRIESNELRDFVKNYRKLVPVNILRWFDFERSINP